MRSLRRWVPKAVCAGVTVILVSVSGVANLAPAGASTPWSVVASPNLAGSRDSQLSGVACTSATFCMAVGVAVPAGQTDFKTLIEHWDGGRWSLVASPSPGRHADLSAVSCTSETSCTAVGSYGVSPETPQAPLTSRTLIEQWDGRDWAVVASPNHSAADSLFGASCTSATFCVAVGRERARALIEQWDGRTWSFAGDPGHGASDDLSSVSCTSATFCLAGGTLVERWDGGRWSAVANASFGLGGLTGVSCTSATECVAVGNTESGAPYNIQSGVLGHWDGVRWSTEYLSNWVFSDISCTSMSNCYAVGSAPGTLVERWDGASWSLVAGPNPTRPGSADLLAVSCVRETTCFAVGFNSVYTGPKPTQVTTTLVVRGPDASGPPRSNEPIVGIAGRGIRGAYWLVASDGGVFSFGGAPFFGSTGARRLNRPIVGMAVTAHGGGYWLVASDGGVFSFGDAHFFGSTGGRRLSRPIVAMAATPSGHGYWLVASDGGVFSFGDAQFFGSTGGRRLNRPIVGMAVTPSGHGYWLVASDGGIFTFGDALYRGSTGGTTLSAPIVGMALTPAIGHRNWGYRLVASDGTVYGFGDAGGQGPPGALSLPAPIVGMFTPPAGRQYLLAASDGETFAF